MTTQDPHDEPAITVHRQRRPPDDDCCPWWLMLLVVAVAFAIGVALGMQFPACGA